MNAIVSVTKNWAIGKDGGLLVRNREDMHRFAKLTRGGIVVMGRMTYESLPHRPLKDRVNLVLTRTLEDKAPSLECFSSPEALLSRLKREDSARVWLIGGEAVYRLFLPKCERAYVTMHDCVIEDADAFFPNLDDDQSWECTHDEPQGQTDEGIAFSYRLYKNLSTCN